MARLFTCGSALLVVYGFRERRGFSSLEFFQIAKRKKERDVAREKKIEKRKT